MYQEIILDYFVIDCDILTFNNAVIFVSPLNKKKKKPNSKLRQVPRSAARNSIIRSNMAEIEVVRFNS